MTEHTIKEYLTNLDKNYENFKSGMQEFIQTELKNVTDVNETLQKELNDYKEEVQNLNKVSIISNLNKQIKNLTKDNEMYKKRYDNQQKTLNELNIQLEKINDENDILRGTNNIHMEEINKIEDSEGSEEDSEGSEEDSEGSENTEYYEIEIGKQTYCIDDNDNIYNYENEEVGNIIGILVNDKPYFKQVLYFSPLDNGLLFEKDHYKNEVGKLNKNKTKKLMSEFME